MDKFALIYEFNKESPLIVYEASKELDKKNFSNALDLLEKASQKFSYHPTVFYLKAVACAYNNQFEFAKQNLIIADNLFGNKQTLEFYNNLIEKIRLGNDDEKFGLVKSHHDFFYKSQMENSEFDNSETSQFISNERINPNVNSFDNDPIVTETLAEIYASQENFTEALEIFEKLIILKPELTEKFEYRIQEIKSAIERKKQNKFGN